MGMGQNAATLGPHMLLNFCHWNSIFWGTNIDPFFGYQQKHLWDPLGGWFATINLHDIDFTTDIVERVLTVCFWKSYNIIPPKEKKNDKHVQLLISWTFQALNFLYSSPNPQSNSLNIPKFQDSQDLTKEL